MDEGATDMGARTGAEMDSIVRKGTAATIVQHSAKRGRRETYVREYEMLSPLATGPRCYHRPAETRHSPHLACLERRCPRLGLSNAVLGGHSMGSGEIARYLGTCGSERVSIATFVSPIPLFLLVRQRFASGIPYN